MRTVEFGSFRIQGISLSGHAVTVWLLSTSSFSNYLSDSSYIYLLLVAWTKKKKKNFALRATAYRAAAWTSVDIDFGPSQAKKTHILTWRRWSCVYTSQRVSHIPR